MSAPCLDRGVLILSADLSPVRGSAGPGLLGLLNLIVDLNLSATWFVADLSDKDKDAVDCVLAARPDQEIGIVADSSWIRANRGIVFRELSRRMVHADASQARLTTLALPAGHAVEHLDLVRKHRISALRIEPDRRPRALWTGPLASFLGSAAADPSAPRLTRYGLWQVPVSQRFPLRDRFSLSSAARHARWAIDKAANTGTFFHLAIDVELMAHGRGAALKGVERMLALALRHHEEGCLTILNIRQLVRTLAEQRRAIPAQSILKRAA